MASAEQVASLRRMVAEPTTATYSDEALSALVDDKGSLDAAAAAVWEEKAAAASTLVNVSESGSSRSMQQIHQNALEMAKFYSGRITEVSADVSKPFTVPAQRP